jgi:NADPH2:quinone reductase
MTKAIRIHKTGGPEVLQWEDVTVGDPGAGEVRIANKAVGLNYIDTYHRSGLYPVPMPSGIGLEAAGVVEAVGPGVTEFKAGDRVAYCNATLGAYSEAKIHQAERLVKIPEGVSFEQAASAMLQGLTVWYLLRRLLKTPQAGETVLWHAAAGGVGLIACQWAKALGVNVIGTVSSEEKAQLARENGCTHTILYTKEDVVAKVKELTGGKGCPVVYDGVGKDTYLKSLDCLQPRGCSRSSATPPDRWTPEHGAARGEGVALRDAPDAHELCRQARRPGRRRQGALRPHPRRPHQGGRAPEVPAQGRGAGPPRPGIPQDHGIDDIGAVAGVG